MEELLSGTWQKSMLASADINSDDHDGFIDTDELLSGRQQKGSTSLDPDYGGMADIDEIGTRGGSPTSSSRPTAGSGRDPIVLNDDESVDAESETDYSSLEVDLTTKSDSSSPHIADNDMADGEGFVSGTIYISDRIVANHQDNDNNSGVVDGARLQLAADVPMLASPGHGPAIHQASPTRVNIEIIQGSASYDDLDVAKEAEDEGIDVFADDEDGADTCSTRSGSSAVSSDNLASDRNVALSELQVGQHDSAQSPQPGPAMVSLEQSDLTNGPLPRYRRRRDDTKNARRKRLRMRAPTGPARTASPVSAALESNDFEHTQSVARLVAPANEREIRDIDHEMADDRGSDDSNDEDYDNRNDAATPEMRHPPRSRKRVKRPKGTEPNDMEITPTQSLNVSCQAIAATPSIDMQESEEIPIRGYLTLKTIDSEVVYSLTFSQDLLLEPGGISQRQGIPRSVSSSNDRRKSEKSLSQEEAMSRPVKKSRFSSEDDDLLLQLKGEGLSWDEISERFPERTKGTLQVHYSTKLKSRSETSKNTKKRRRSG
jgi:hypothetical protein